MAHRETIKEYLGKISLDERRVIDWGMGTKPVTKYCRGKAKTYFGVDKLNHVGADLVADVDSNEFPEDKLPPHNVAFCMEMIEHVKYPANLLKRIHYWLETGGTFYFSVPFLYPIHSPEDYWRFTDQGLKLLLENTGFKVVEILPTDDNMGWVGCAVKPHGN